MLSTFLVTFGIFLLAADPALAGPAAGVFAAVGTIIKGSAVLSAIAQIGVSMALSKISQKMMAKKMAKMQAQQTVKTAVSFDVQVGDTVDLSIIVGKFATAGNRKSINSWGKNSRFITEVVEVSALPVPDFVGLWVDETKADVQRNSIGILPGSAADAEEIQSLPAGSPGMVVGHPVLTPQTGDSPLIWIKWVDGNQTSADPFVGMVTSASSWPLSGKGTGKAYAVITYQYHKDRQTGQPKFLIEPQPLPMYDPRKDGSTGGVGAHRWGDRSTYEPSENPMVICYNIVRGIYYGTEWVYGGKNLPAWRLPRAAWVTAMNACDRPIEGQPSYRCGTEIGVSTEPADVLEELGRSCNGRFSEVGGRLKPMVELPSSAVFTITDADILITEGQTFNPFYPMADTYNSISATYPEPAEKWTTRDAPERIFYDELGKDGGRYLPVSIGYPTCPYHVQVQRLMQAQMAEFRRMRHHTITLPPSAYVLEPMDMISWTSARNGYVEKKFIVEQVTTMAGLVVPVALREVDPSDYTWTSDMELEQVITAPVNPIPVPQGITGWTAVSALINDNDGRGRRAAIVVSCGQNEVGVTDIRIQIEQAENILFDVTRPYAPPYVWTLTDVASETTYRVRGALLSEFTGGFEWSPWITVTTPTESVWLDDLSDEIIAEFERLAAEGGIKTVDALPATGDFADQIVMLRSSKQFYRWDEPTSQWSTSVYAGVADNSITSNKIVSNNILSNHIAASNILSTHIGAGQVTADKINVSQLSAITADVGLLRTATSGGRMEIHGNRLLVFDAGGTLRVRLGYLL